MYYAYWRSNLPAECDNQGECRPQSMLTGAHQWTAWHCPTHTTTPPPPANATKVNSVDRDKLGVKVNTEIKDNLNVKDAPQVEVNMEVKDTKKT